jgi:DNA-binding CsgD family transcriptional regulator
MHRVFQSFIDALAEGVDATSLHAALSLIAEAFDFPLFAYLAIPPDDETPPWLISNYAPAWTTRYVAENFERLDPVVAACSGAEPFLWGGERAGLLAAQRDFMAEAAGFGIRRGLTLPIPAHGISMAAVTFATDAPARRLCRVAQLHGPLLQLISIYFHRQARRVLNAERMIKGILLTRREYECLGWAACGKSARDIGAILGITRRTAAFHLDNARAKLGVASITQAVALFAAAVPRD